ncbi:MAG TPA: FadR/GntR family transcriptional regulator [Caulobacterales bacterium]|nr:FadR/GntR family transcriptional regulator [Caulobacterales bacterium]
MTHNRKLYQTVADAIVTRIQQGKYALGRRLPSERDLAEEMQVSRPTIREAMIALEIRGLVVARHGSGIYVAETLPVENAADTELDIGPFELIEARRLFEGEAAALAAHTITEDEIADLKRLLDVMQNNRDSSIGERADGDFHITVAEATRNTAIANVIETFWELRNKSPLCIDIFARGRLAGVEQPVEDHRYILGALMDRDAKAAREAMHAHLDNVFQAVLNATEMDAIKRTRSEIAAKRAELERRSRLYRPARAKIGEGA